MLKSSAISCYIHKYSEKKARTSGEGFLKTMDVEEAENQNEATQDAVRTVETTSTYVLNELLIACCSH